MHGSFTEDLTVVKKLIVDLHDTASGIKLTIETLRINIIHRKNTHTHLNLTLKTHIFGVSITKTMLIEISRPIHILEKCITKASWVKGHLDGVIQYIKTHRCDQNSIK